jgi:hypothetical protein
MMGEEHEKYLDEVCSDRFDLPYAQEFSRDNISHLKLILPFSRGLIFTSVA